MLRRTFIICHGSEIILGDNDNICFDFYFEKKTIPMLNQTNESHNVFDPMSQPNVAGTIETVDFFLNASMYVKFPIQDAVVTSTLFNNAIDHAT